MDDSPRDELGAPASPPVTSGEFVPVSMAAVIELIEEGRCPKAKAAIEGRPDGLRPDVCVWCELAVAVPVAAAADRG